MFNNNFYAGNCGVDPDAGYDFPNGPTPEEEESIEFEEKYNYVIDELLNKLKEIDVDSDILSMVAVDLASMKY